MSPLDWATRPLKKYADFSGRAPRAEFWWFVLLVCIGIVVALILERILDLQPILVIYGPLTLAVIVATLVPSIAVQTRRLHDTGRPAWWLVAFYILYFGYMYMALGNLETLSAGDMSSLASVGILAIAMVIYSIVLIVFYVLKGTHGPNKYGDDPCAGGASRAM